jgi:hypothetical protein
MNKAVKSVCAVVFAVVIAVVVAVFVSRYVAIKKANQFALPALTLGWQRFDARLVIWTGEQFHIHWWIRYVPVDRAIDFPESVSVSPFGKITSTSLPESLSQTNDASIVRPAKPIFGAPKGSVEQANAVYRR